MKKILSSAAGLTLALMAANCAPGTSGSTSSSSSSSSSGATSNNSSTGTSGGSSAANSSGGNSSGGNSSGGNSSGASGASGEHHSSGTGTSGGTSSSGGTVGSCGNNTTRETALAFTVGEAKATHACATADDGFAIYYFKATGQFAATDTLSISTTGLDAANAADVDVAIAYEAADDDVDICTSVNDAGENEECSGEVGEAQTTIYVRIMVYADETDVDQAFSFTVTRGTGGTASSGEGTSSEGTGSSGEGTASSGEGSASSAG